MIRKALITGMAIVCCVSLHAMKAPEKGALAQLQQRHEQQRHQAQPVIESIHENNFISGRQYKVVFSTGKIILCTHWFQGLRGAPEYDYREEDRGGFRGSLRGDEAAVRFEQYKSLYEHIQQK